MTAKKRFDLLYTGISGIFGAGCCLLYYNLFNKILKLKSLKVLQGEPPRMLLVFAALLFVFGIVCLIIWYRTKASQPAIKSTTHTYKAPNKATKTAVHCETCDVVVDQKVINYCKFNSKEFGGRILCRSCQVAN